MLFAEPMHLASCRVKSTPPAATSGRRSPPPRLGVVCSATREEEEAQRLRVIPQKRRAVVSGLLAGLVGIGPSSSYLSPSRAEAKALAPVEACLKSLQSAIEELRDMRSAVQLRDKLGIELQYETYSDLRKKLNSQALGDVRKVAETADTYIGEAPLGVIDEQVWRSMPNDEDAEGEKRRTVKVPFGPNGVLCVIFSCVNDPRMMPSTDLLLTKQMLDTGLRMGMAYDSRISTQGILSNIDDLESKLVTYTETLRERTSFNKPKRTSETPPEIND